MIKVIMLAAGQSKRLKGENKLIKNYKKKPLIVHTINSFKRSKVSKIIFVLGYQNKEVKKIIKKNKKFIFVLNKSFKLSSPSLCFRTLPNNLGAIFINTL